ncbi:unnamed protein product [Prunus armeniaca]
MLDRFNLQKPHTVLQAEGTLRMCMDYRALNKATVKNKYHVPNMADLFDRLSKATYFTKLDLHSVIGKCALWREINQKLLV